MADAAREPKRPRQEDSEMADGSTVAPTGRLPIILRWLFLTTSVL